MQSKLIKGPFDLPMSEKLAKDLEQLLKTVEPKNRRLARTSVSPKAIDLPAGERSDISLITTNALDREFEVVLPEGIILDYYRQNPIVTFAHNYESFPESCIGRCKWIKQIKDGILAKTIYATKPENWSGDWLPDAIFALTQQGVIKGKSIGFVPLSLRDPTAEELKSYPTWKDARAVIDRAALVEYAVAPVPANPTCLVQEVSKSWSKKTLTTLGLPAPKTKLPSSQKIINEIMSRLRGDV